MSYYPDISTINATTDVTQLLIYCNTVTHELFAPLTAFGFFFVVLLGSYFAQMRLTGRPKFDISFVIASFTSVGFSVIMAINQGLLAPFYVVIFILLSIISIAWVFFSEPS